MFHLRFIAPLALPIVLLTAQRSHAQIADYEIKGTCTTKPTCTFVQGGSNLARNCFAPDSDCATDCKCRDVIGMAHWYEGEWRGAYNDCFCVNANQARGPRNYLWGVEHRWFFMHYEWIVYQRSSFLAGQHVLDVAIDPRSFASIFDLAAVDRATSVVQESLLLLAGRESVTGTLSFTDLEAPTGVPGETYWRLDSVTLAIDSVPFLGDFTGPSAVQVEPVGTNLVIFDSNTASLRSEEELRFRVENSMFPGGVNVGLELNMFDEGSGWRAYGRGRAGMDTLVTSDYDPAAEILTYSIAGARAHAYVLLAIAEACAADVNRDRKVDVADQVLIAEAFGWTGTPGAIAEDVNFDGAVDMADFEFAEMTEGDMESTGAALPGCSMTADVDTPYVLVVATDQFGEATLMIPTSGLPFGALRAQVIDLANCTKSNLTRTTIH